MSYCLLIFLLLTVLIGFYMGLYRLNPYLGSNSSDSSNSSDWLIVKVAKLLFTARGHRALAPYFMAMVFGASSVTPIKETLDSL